MAIVMSSVKWRQWNYGLQNWSASCICKPECPYELANSGGEAAPLNYVADHQIRENLCSSVDVDMVFTWNSFGVLPNDFTVATESTTIYNTGCVLGSGSANITIPAGSSLIQVLVVGNCAGVSGDDLYSYSLLCA